MIKTFNSIVATGTLGRDARINNVGNNRVASFSIATDSSYKKSDGNFVNETTWLNVCAWERTGICNVDRLKKGVTVTLTGSVRQRSYKNNAGEDVTIYEIQAATLEIISAEATSNSNAARSQPSTSANDLNDDLPF